MRGRRTIWLMAIIVFVIPFGAFAVYQYYERSFAVLPIYGEVEVVDGTKQYHTISDFNLTNQDAKPISSSNWKDKIVVADFFFTYCPTICPKMTRSLKRVQEAFQDDENSVLINSFSIDPERDDPQRLKSYAKKFSISNHNWELLTGSKEEIYKLARNGFMIVATDGDGGPNDFIHSEKLVLIDKQRRIRGYYNGTDEKEVNNLIQDIKKLQHEK